MIPAAKYDKDLIVGTDERGWESIEIYGLNRRELVAKRRAKRVRLQNLLDLLGSVLERFYQLEDGAAESRAACEADICGLAELFKAELDAEAEFLLLGRQVVLSDPSWELGFGG